MYYKILSMYLGVLMQVSSNLLMKLTEQLRNKKVFFMFYELGSLYYKKNSS